MEGKGGICMTIRPQAKNFFKSIFIISWILMIVYIAYMHFISIAYDEDGILVSIDILEFHKTIVLMNN